MTLGYTLLTSCDGSLLTKRFALKADGTIGKTSHAQPSRSVAETRCAADLREFGRQIGALFHTQAVMFGVMAGSADRAVVLPEGTRQEGDGTVSRTRRHFEFDRAPGIMMLDCDPASDAPAMSPDELRAAIVAAAPELENAPMLIRRSASSRVGRAGEIAVLRGLRVYIAVADASLVPAAGKALIDRLWAEGHGRVVVGRAGQALERTLIDAAVWQPERLDFAAAPIVDPPLQLLDSDSRYYGDSCPPFDLRCITADGAVRARAGKARKAAKRDRRGECDDARERWIEEHASALAARRNRKIADAQRALRRAAKSHELTAEFELQMADGKVVTVDEILRNPARFHDSRCADPLEPDYGDDPRIAYVCARPGIAPYIYSHAHGGQRYKLVRRPVRIEMRAGQEATATDVALDALRQRGDVYEYGTGSLARVDDAHRVRIVTAEWLTDLLARTVDFFTEKIGSDGPIERSCNVPRWLAQSILAKSGEWGLPRLDAVVSVPTLRADGSVLDDPGYDTPSALLYLPGDVSTPKTPAEPTIEHAIAALRVLWNPVSLFPFVDDVARGVALAAMLTSCLRASLPTAPGFGIDANAAGTGKTLLAQTIAALGVGHPPPALAPADNEDETRKRLFAALRDGLRVLLWDNVRGPLGNAALDAFLTASSFSDRVLGASTTEALPNKALFLATGNNLQLVGDTCRRVLVSRLDAGMERPDTRSFEFNPLQTVIAERERLTIAAITIVRAWIAAGRPRVAPGSTASYDTWDALVRQPITWISQRIAERAEMAPDLQPFADPIDGIERAYALDPEIAQISALHDAWDKCFGRRLTTVSEVVSAVETAMCDNSIALREVVREIAGERGPINRKALGRWFLRHVDRRVDGRRLVRGAQRDGRTAWVLARA